MMNSVKIKTTIKEYKENKNNAGKVAIFHKESSTIIFEGGESDWYEMNH